MGSSHRCTCFCWLKSSWLEGAELLAVDLILGLAFFYYQNGDAGMELRTLMRSIFNPWVILGSIGVAGALFAATLLLVWFTRPTTTAAIPATPVMVVIPAPSSTPIPATAEPAANATATLPLPPAPAPGIL